MCTLCIYLYFLYLYGMDGKTDRNNFCILLFCSE